MTTVDQRRKLIAWVASGVAGLGAIGLIAYGISGQEKPGPRLTSASAPLGSVTITEDCNPEAQDACKCFVERTMHAALGVNLTRAEELLDAGRKKCSAELDFKAAEAEVLALAGKAAKAKQLAEAVLARDNTHRGAQRTLAIIAVSNRDFAQAEKILDALLAANAHDPSARYQQALIAHQRGLYHDAREGYLKALKQYPGYVDARYQLVLLTSRAGVQAEANHHLRKLKQIAPLGDSRITNAVAAIGHK